VGGREKVMGSCHTPILEGNIFSVHIKLDSSNLDPTLFIYLRKTLPSL
jgi:hypothetical protein